VSGRESLHFECGLLQRQRRYFLRKGSVLEYYKEQNGKPGIYKGYIDLDLCSECRCAEECLLLVWPGRIVRIQFLLNLIGR
jgi:hypothetical protein